MQGMKEPQAINTVGSPLAPKDSSGRQGYAFPIIGAGLMAAARAFWTCSYERIESRLGPRGPGGTSENLGFFGRTFNPATDAG